MKVWRQELIENLDKYLLNPDEKFQFKCLACGKCCKNREDILLTPRDLYNIAKKLDLTIQDVIEKYCDIYIGQDSRLPIVRLLPQGSGLICPLLQNKRCSVHDMKPTVCALYPIGRVRMPLFENDTATPVVRVLEDCGVYKQTEQGQAALLRFIESI